MDKIFIILITGIIFSLNVLAGELQQIDENKLSIQIKSEVNSGSKYDNDYLIREDYYGYQNGKNSLYGYIVNGLQDVNKYPNESINKYYLTLLKNKIDNIIVMKNDSYDDFLKRKEYLKKINVPDKDYMLLTENTKMVINMLNILLGM